MNAADPIVEQLRHWGPQGCAPVTATEAVGYCRALTSSRRENFSVLSALVPPRLRDDFAAVYAFCRWADDLGDESETSSVGATEDERRARALDLLAWWREELKTCWTGTPRHPVMIALRRTVEAHGLPSTPFEDLISAFERDQRQDRYDTWEELLDYCRQSANPVGRIVLMILGEPRTEAFFAPSDAICTALQLTNHWQDICRDRLERNRIYIPRSLNPIDRFEERLERSARQGFACDSEFLEQSRCLVRSLVEHTWPLYGEGSALIERVDCAHRGLIWLFSAGGERTLDAIGAWNFETVLHRPRVSAPMRAWLVARAWLMVHRARERPGQGDRHRAEAARSLDGERVAGESAG